MKITDKKQLMKLMSFITMSDGSVQSSRGSKNHIFSFAQTEDHEDFVMYVKGIVENNTSVKTYYYEMALPRRNQIKIYTRVHPYFNDLRDRIYVGNYKSIDQHALKLLDFEALAILYMSDGCLGKYIRENGKPSYTLTINMCRLSYGDQLIMKKAIKEKLDLEFNVVKTGKKYYTLRLRSKDLEKFMNGISPYILDSFKYKIDFRTTNPVENNAGGDIV